MVAQTTIDTINLVKDIDFEYNIKLIILSLLFIYSCALLFISFKWETEELWQKLIKIFILQIPSAIYLFFLPLFSIYLLRTVSWESIYSPLIAYFTYLLIVILLTGKLGLFTFFANLLGIDTEIEKMELKNK